MGRRCAAPLGAALLQHTGTAMGQFLALQRVLQSDPVPSPGCCPRSLVLRDARDNLDATLAPPWLFCLRPPQDTVAEMAREIKTKRTGEVSASADELFQFINKVGARAVSEGQEGRRACGGLGLGMNPHTPPQPPMPSDGLFRTLSLRSRSPSQEQDSLTG
jgi:hypothetical protein